MHAKLWSHIQLRYLGLYIFICTGCIVACASSIVILGAGCAEVSYVQDVLCFAEAVLHEALLALASLASHDKGYTHQYNNVYAAQRTRKVTWHVSQAVVAGPPQMHSHTAATASPTHRILGLRHQQPPQGYSYHGLHSSRGVQPAVHGLGPTHVEGQSPLT